MKREEFLYNKKEMLERLNRAAESLTSATRVHYDTDEDADLEDVAEKMQEDIELIKACLENFENMIGDIEELQCQEDSIV